MAISSREFPPGAIAKGRVSNRLSIGFVLDVVSLARAQRHLVDTLLMTSIVQAILGPLAAWRARHLDGLQPPAADPQKIPQNG
jgi:hypothetical protein